MSVNSERKPFSVPEFFGGGIALATVALIAFGGLRVTQPQNSTRDVQSPDTRLGTGNSAPIESNGAKAPRPPAADRPAAPAAVRADSNFIGGWTDDVGRCRTGRKAPLVISSRAAKTANGECDFGFVAREAANRWRVTAICAAEGRFWRANIALKLMEPNLTWSSERGTETYVRCKRRWRSGRL